MKQQHARFPWSAILLMVMLQRSSLVRYLADFHLSLIPRTQHLWALVAGAVTAGAYNSVTAASGDLSFFSGARDTTVKVGEQLRLVLVVGGNNEPKSYKVTGQLPSGVRHALDTKSGLITFSGRPTVAGSYPLSVQGWRKEKFSGTATPIFRFTIVVDTIGPDFSKQPLATSVDWGGSGELSITLKYIFGASYQWQRQSAENLQVYDDLIGETASTLSFANVTSQDQGLYRVSVTRNNLVKVSNAALVTINASAFQIWKEENFQDPFVSESALDPDKDELTNAIEFTFGLNPNHSENHALIEMYTEVIDGVLYAVHAFPPVPGGVDSSIILEANSGLEDTQWVVLEEGVIVESNPEGYFVKIPAVPRSFFRFRIIAQ